MIRTYMTQYKLAFSIILLSLTCMVNGLSFAEPTSQTAASAPSKTASPTAKIKKSPEAYFSDGLACLKRGDIACAQVALANTPSQSAYAKLLTGNIAAANQDFDSVFLLLLPLQADKTLTKEAGASLHASLALAYDNQGNTLRALEQRVAVESLLETPEAIQVNQSAIWQSLSAASREDLIEMRGNSLDTTIQGWVDLALTASNPSKQAYAAWHSAYPDHPATSIAQQLGEQYKAAAQAPTASGTKNITGQIALILPFSAEAYYPAADAIERGFMTAQQIDKGTAEVKIYPTQGDKNEIYSIYLQALNEGAHYVVGPLTRDEVGTLLGNRLAVPTLTLNYPETAAPLDNLYSYGLSADTEAAQIVKIARDLGMQSAAIVMSDDALSNRIAKSFSDAWIADGGQVKLNSSVADNNGLTALKSQIAAHPTDMIFIAANAEAARVIRPYLDIATPCFGISHIYSGIWQNSDDAPLTAVRFVDMPWLLDSTNPDFASYQLAATDLPPGEMQRWFALGADAYKLLSKIAEQPHTPFTLNGLTGKIQVSASGQISRELALGRFSKEGVVLEKKP